MDLKQAQENTALGLVNEIFQTGNFEKCPLTQKVGEKEKVIGEMLDYEKAIELARENLFNKYKEEVAAKTMDAQKHYMYKSDMELTGKLLWNSIRHRFGDAAFAGGGIGARENWQIVTTDGEEDSGIMFGVHVLEIHM